VHPVVAICTNDIDGILHSIHSMQPFAPMEEQDQTYSQEIILSNWCITGYISVRHGPRINPALLLENDELTELCPVGVLLSTDSSRSPHL